MATPHVAGAAALLLSVTNIKNVPEAQRAVLMQDLLTASVGRKTLSPLAPPPKEGDTFQTVKSMIPVIRAVRIGRRSRCANSQPKHIHRLLFSAQNSGTVEQKANL